MKTRSDLPQQKQVFLSAKESKMCSCAVENLERESTTKPHVKKI